MNLQSLRPYSYGTTFVAVTTSSQAVAVPNGAGIVSAFLNRGGGDVFVEFGTNNQVVARAPSAGNVGSTPIGANLPLQQLTMPPGTTHAAFVGSANASLYWTRGELI